jgi:hypothetical protein
MRTPRAGRSLDLVRGLRSVTADPNPTNWGPAPTWTYAVVPIAPVVPVPSVPIIVIASVVLIMIAPMILVMIVLFRVALILLILMMVIIAFASKSRYGKHQSTCYRANEGESANHLVFLCH